MSLASAEGIKTELMLRVPGRLPGLYLIETDTKGERRFTYWREPRRRANCSKCRNGDRSPKR